MLITSNDFFCFANESRGKLAVAPINCISFAVCFFCVFSETFFSIGRQNKTKMIYSLRSRLDRREIRDWCLRRLATVRHFFGLSESGRISTNHRQTRDEHSNKKRGKYFKAIANYCYWRLVLEKKLTRSRILAKTRVKYRDRCMRLLNPNNARSSVFFYKKSNHKKYTY